MNPKLKAAIIEEFVTNKAAMYSLKCKAAARKIHNYLFYLCFALLVGLFLPMLKTMSHDTGYFITWCISLMLIMILFSAAMAMSELGD